MANQLEGPGRQSDSWREPRRVLPCSCPKLSGPRGDQRLDYERVEFLFAKAFNPLQPGTPGLAAVDFDRAGDQHLADRAERRGSSRIHFSVALGSTRIRGKVSRRG
jgi:hypothetical protein